MTDHVTIAVTMPERLARATLEAASHAGQRSGETSIRLDHFIILSERAFNALLEAAERPLSGGSKDSIRGGAAKTPERAAIPAPAIAERGAETLQTGC